MVGEVTGWRGRAGWGEHAATFTRERIGPAPPHCPDDSCPKTTSTAIAQTPVLSHIADNYVEHTGAERGFQLQLLEEDRREKNHGFR